MPLRQGPRDRDRADEWLGSVDMLQRYHGRLTTQELARCPTTLSKYAEK
jgi:hypothetical protein